MATIHSGTQGVIYVGTDEALNIRSFSIEETQETIDATAMDVNGVSYRTTKPTFKSWSGSFDCYWTVTEGAEGADHADAMAFTKPSSDEVVLHFWPTGDDEDGDIEYTGSAYITGRTISSSVDGMIEMSISVAGTGALSTANATIPPAP